MTILGSIQCSLFLDVLVITNLDCHIWCSLSCFMKFLPGIIHVQQEKIKKENSDPA